MWPDATMLIVPTVVGRKSSDLRGVLDLCTNVRLGVRPSGESRTAVDRSLWLMSHESWLSTLDVIAFTSSYPWNYRFHGSCRIFMRLSWTILIKNALKWPPILKYYNTVMMVIYGHYSWSDFDEKSRLCYSKNFKRRVYGFRGHLASWVWKLCGFEPIAFSPKISSFLFGTLLARHSIV